MDGSDGMADPLLAGGLLGADGFVELHGGLVGRPECAAPPSAGPQLRDDHHFLRLAEFHHQKHVAFNLCAREQVTHRYKGRQLQALTPACPCLQSA